MYDVTYDTRALDRARADGVNLGEPMRVNIGIDLGMKQDPSTIVVVEAEKRQAYDEHEETDPLTLVRGGYEANKGTCSESHVVDIRLRLLQARCIHWPTGEGCPDAAVLAAELADFDVRTNENATEVYGAKTGKHDDLAVALG